MTDQEPIRPGQEQRPDARATSRLDWWREARFGMFIHWGLYAVPAGRWNGRTMRGRNGRKPIGEWIQLVERIPGSDYETLAARFNPTGFDAEAWVRLAKRAGQKYLVITAKHHDGFCMFDSKLTEFDIVDATPFGRDPMKELARACQEHGVKLCFYYSQTQDWHHPDGDGNDWDYSEQQKDFDGYIENYVKPQVRELLTNYGPIGLIWFDTPKRITREQSRSLVDFVHDLQPDCLVNGRIGNGLGDYAEAADNTIPAEKLDVDWETPATINDTWGYMVDDHNWKSAEELIRKLVDIVSKGGNYLLNVGPTAEGTLPEPSVERLEAVGRWLTAHGDSIHGTGPGPIQGLNWCRTTARPGSVFVHVLDWPKGGSIRLPDIGPTVRRASLLTVPDNALSMTRQDADLIIQAPEHAPDAAVSVIRLEMSA